jgi:hypothetical protein
MSEKESKSVGLLFDTGKLVVTPSGFVGIVEPSSQTEADAILGTVSHYRIKCQTRSGMVIEHVYGERLRAINRREYWWHRNPETGTFQVGRTNWYEWIGQFLLSVFAMWAAFDWLDAHEMDERIGRYILLLIGTVRILALVVGVESNYKLDTRR